MSKMQVHYNIDNLDKEDANFNLIIGEKSNGKSYQIKHKKGVEHYLETGKRFILMRRWEADITSLWIEKYFSDVDVAKLTKNKYNCITSYRKTLYFSKYDVETGKTKRGEPIGYVVALSTEQHMSSASFLDVDIIIFEEFIERGSYLQGMNEPDKMMIFYSTIDRKRGTTKVYMAGNSITKVCPYFKAWGLDKIFKEIKQGEIKTKIIHNEENDVKLAVEFCQSSGGKTMAIGNAKNMIDKGAWQTSPQPKLPESYKNYKVCFQIGFLYQGFKFLGEYIRNSKWEYIWFIKPYNKEFKDKLIVFSDEIKTSPYWQRDIYNPSFENDTIKKVLQTFKENAIFYSDDLTGTDFKQVIDFTIRR